MRIGHMAPTRSRWTASSAVSRARSSSALSSVCSAASALAAVGRAAKRLKGVAELRHRAARARAAGRAAVERGGDGARRRRGRDHGTPQSQGARLHHDLPSRVVTSAATHCWAMGRPIAEAPAIRMAGMALRASSGDHPAERTSRWTSRRVVAQPARTEATGTTRAAAGVRTAETLREPQQRQHREHGGKHQRDGGGDARVVA